MVHYPNFRFLRDILRKKTSPQHRKSPTSWLCHQHLKSVTIIKSPTSPTNHVIHIFVLWSVHEGQSLQFYAPSSFWIAKNSSLEAFHFRWLKIKGIYAALPILITLSVNLLKWNSSYSMLLVFHMVWSRIFKNNRKMGSYMAP